MSDVAIAKPWLFNAEKARLAAIKSHEPDSARFKPDSALNVHGNQTQEIADPLADGLTRVQGELVKQMEGNKDAKAISALAMALKNVRETYHLVTGQAKPGVLRETKARGRRDRAQAAPEPEVDVPQATRRDDPNEPNG